jgi:hypothetical protein
MAWAAFGNSIPVEIGPRPGQQQFGDAILNGGQATAEVDGQVVIIDEVEIVPG